MATSMATPNYGFGTWAPEDILQIEDINKVINDIDKELFGSSGKAHATFVVGHGHSSAGGKVDFLCDGIDDQEEINAAINALPEGAGGKILIMEGTYHLTGTIKIEDRDNVVLEGIRGNTILCKEWDGTTIANNSVVHIINSNHAAICNLTLDGNRSKYASTNAYGIYCASGEHVVYSNNTIHSFVDFGLRHNSGLFPVAYNNEVYDCASTGIQLYTGASAAWGCIAYGNIVHDNLDSGLYAYPYAVAIGNTAYNNTSYGVRVGNYSTAANNIAVNNNNGVSGGNYSAITGNVAQGNSNYGINGGTQAAISGNTAIENGSYGILGGSYAAVTGNTARANNQGIYISGNGTATGNTAYNNELDGIVCENNYSLISSNNCYNNGTSGINIASNYNVVTGNMLRGNGTDGILSSATSGTYNLIHSNACYTNKQYGIKLTGNYHSVAHNLTRSNTSGGISNGGANNTLSDNIIY